MFRALLALLVLITGITCCEKAEAQVTAQEIWVQNTGNQVISTLQIFNNELRFTALRNLIDEIFDKPYIARQIIGPKWNNLDENLRSRFIQVFENYIIYIYAGQPLNAGAVSLTVTGSQLVGGSKPITKVFATLKLNNNPNNVQNANTDGNGKQIPLNVAFLIESESSSYKIVDMNVSGISMILFVKRIFAGKMQENQNNIFATLHNLENNAQEAAQGNYKYPQIPSAFGN